MERLPSLNLVVGLRGGPAAASDVAMALQNRAALLLGVATRRFLAHHDELCTREQLDHQTRLRFCLAAEADACAALAHTRGSVKALLRRGAARAEALRLSDDGGAAGLACAACSAAHNPAADFSLAESMIADAAGRDGCDALVGVAADTRHLDECGGMTGVPPQPPLLCSDVAVVDVGAEGRGVVASTSLAAGVLVLREHAHAVVPLSCDRAVVRCDACLGACGIGLPCGCVVAVVVTCATCRRDFCSWSCARDVDSWHAASCGARSDAGADAALATMLLRSPSLSDSRTPLRVVEALYGSAISLSRGVKALDCDAAHGALDDALRIVHTNCIAVRVTTDAYPSPFASASGDDDAGRPAEVVVGTALLAGVSMFNHSCIPNCVVSFVGRTALVRTTRAVAAGEQLHVSYGPLATRQSDAEARRDDLRRRYGFTCHCAACSVGGKASRFPGSTCPCVQPCAIVVS
jgi:hypothetical protein